MQSFLSFKNVFRPKLLTTLRGYTKERFLQDAIAGIIVMQPDCIVLDEPTAMLDPKGRKEIINTILKLNREKNITVILITHYMEEAETLSDRIGIMKDGCLLATGTVEELKRTAGTEFAYSKVNIL